MKLFLVLAVCIVGSFAEVADWSYGYSKPEVRNSSYEGPALNITTNEADPVFNFSYEVYNGQYKLDVKFVDSKTEISTLKQLPEGPAVVESGSYIFTVPNGRVFNVSYTAQKNDSQTTGTDLKDKMLSVMPPAMIY